MNALFWRVCYLHHLKNMILQRDFPNSFWAKGCNWLGVEHSPAWQFVKLKRSYSNDHRDHMISGFVLHFWYPHQLWFLWKTRDPSVIAIQTGMSFWVLLRGFQIDWTKFHQVGCQIDFRKNHAADVVCCPWWMDAENWSRSWCFTVKRLQTHTHTQIPICSLLPSASDFEVGFGTPWNRVFGALGFFKSLDISLVSFFFMFIPTWGNAPIGRRYFWEGGWFDHSQHITEFRFLEGVSLIIVWWRCEGFESQIDKHRSSHGNLRYPPQSYPPKK